MLDGIAVTCAASTLHDVMTHPRRRRQSVPLPIQIRDTLHFSSHVGSTGQSSVETFGHFCAVKRGRNYKGVTMKSSQLKATPYHDAGHAVVAYSLDIELEEEALIIKPPADYAGLFVYRNPLSHFSLDVEISDESRLKAERVVQVLLAGIEAQRRHRTSCVRQWHALSDYQNAVDVISYFAPDRRETEAYIKLLGIRVQIMFDDPIPWKCVEAIATVPLDRKTLSGQEAINIIRATFLWFPI
jgi:hypothetical protein